MADGPILMESPEGRRRAEAARTLLDLQNTTPNAIKIRGHEYTVMGTEGTTEAKISFALVVSTPAGISDGAMKAIVRRYIGLGAAMELQLRCEPNALVSEGEE